MPTGCAECGAVVPYNKCSWHPAERTAVSWDSREEKFVAVLSRGLRVRCSRSRVDGEFWFYYCKECKKRALVLGHILRGSKVVDKDRHIEDKTDVENYSFGNSDSDDPGPEQAGPGPVDNQSTVPMRPSNPAPCNPAAEVVLSRRYVTAASQSLANPAAEYALSRRYVTAASQSLANPAAEVARSRKSVSAASRVANVSRSRSRSAPRRRSNPMQLTVRELGSTSDYLPFNRFQRAGFADTELDTGTWLKRLEALRLFIGCHESLTRFLGAKGLQPKPRFRDLVRQAYQSGLISKGERSWLHDVRIGSQVEFIFL